VSRPLRGLAPAALLALLALAAGSCGGQAAGAAAGPRLETRWTGSDTAGFAAPAVAEYCDSLNLVEIRAAAGDTGIAILIFPKDRVQSGDYPIRHPDVADTVPVSAAVALRWVALTSVRGFRGASGRLTLRRGPGGALSGSFAAGAGAVSGPGRLTVTGSFEYVPVRPATRGCAPRAASGDSTAGVD